MSANNDFPKKTDYSMWEAYPPEEVDSWFQRCIEDWDRIERYTAEEDYHFTGYLKEGQVLSWFDSWLSQFRNKCQK